MFDTFEDAHEYCKTFGVDPCFEDTFDVAMALYRAFVAGQHGVQPTDCPVCCGRGFNVDWNKNRVQCSTCNGTCKR